MTDSDSEKDKQVEEKFVLKDAECNFSILIREGLQYRTRQQFG